MYLCFCKTKRQRERKNINHKTKNGTLKKDVCTINRYFCIYV